MFKRAMMIGILGVSLVAMLSREVGAHAEGWQTINGYLRHVASFDCGIKVKQVSNLTQHPLVFKCTATITLVQTVCRNPAGNEVDPGEAATQVTIVGQDDFKEGDITDKKKGRAEKFVTINENTVFGVGQQGSEFCVNDNWFLQDVLVLEVTALFETYECLNPDDPNCVDRLLAYKEKLDCTLPPQYSISNQPPLNTFYECVLVSKEHVN